VYDKSYPECDFYCIKVLDRIIESSSSGQLGSVLVEPYQGASGFIFPPEGWLKALEEWAQDRGLLLIIDEVQSSFGRTGKLYAIEWESIRPQMLCLGKGFGSGMPSSALAAESEIFLSMNPGELSSTWGGNPLASAASLAVLDVMAEEKLPENALKVGELLKEGLLELQKKYSILGDVRGRGLVIGLEIVEQGDGYSPSAELTNHILIKAAENGMLLGRVGLYGNVIRIAPPLVINEDEVEIGVQILDKVFSQLA
jgi:4-aminobutyrate aminotransferase-like enzyme